MHEADLFIVRLIEGPNGFGRRLQERSCRDAGIEAGARGRGHHRRSVLSQALRGGGLGYGR